MQTSGPEAVELAASAGLVLDPWQQDAVCDLLGEDADGYWSATTGGLVCPRQNGKGAVIEALELAWLFLCDVDLIFHSAHLFATASDAFRRIKGLIQNTPDLHRQVLKYSEAHGQEGIELRNGKRLRFVARSKSGGRGFPAPVVVLDEAFNLSAPMMAALVPTMAAQANPFLLVTSSAPIDDPCSDELRKFMRRSRMGVAERRCYIEYSADRDASLEDQLRQANPGYGVRLNMDVIDEEMELLTADAFAVERLGIVDLDSTPGSVTLPGWPACLDPLSGPVGAVAFGLEVSPDRSWASFGVAAESGRGGVHVEVTSDEDGQFDYRPGTAWVVERARQLTRRWRASVGVAKGSPAESLVPDLEAAKVKVTVLSGPQQAQACGSMYDAVIAGGVRHLGQPMLDAAVAGAVQKRSGDTFTFDRRSTVDICPLGAVTWAKWVLENAPRARARFVDLSEFEE